ncbi:LPXTG cell wall anchor domain-containing protein [Piscibacillus sp. B03]|uniref:LPXTG cell wall anchor domain-containing protein n=1 Tax=Piscibacillus sp. B03 TaxID=3457430 RepID=UPI003FCEC499
MKKYLKWRVLVVTVLVCSSLICYSPIYADSEDISISTTPEQVLFDVTNIKPGDWFEREVVIENDGEKDFVYYIDSRMISGSEKLYNHMNFKIEDSNGEILYEGKLGDYKGLEYRELTAGEKEDLLLVAEFPPESGNEFQGLETNFSIRILARAEPIEVPDDVEDLPDEPEESDNQDKPKEDDSDEQAGRDKGDSGGSDNEEATSEEQVKGDQELPQTGEEIPYLFYIIGGLFLVSGTILFLITRRIASGQK